MHGGELDLERVLDHAPVIALARVVSAKDALCVASSCIAGGFRTLLVDLSTEGAVALIASLTPRHDTIVGCLASRGTQGVSEALAAGATFVVDCGDLDEVAELVEAERRVWIPRITTPERAAVHRRSEERWGWYEPGAQSSFHSVVASGAERRWLAGPGIAGNRLEEWIDAGAYALVLSEAIYSAELLQQGDRRSIRDYAAAVHREATRHARTARETQ